MRFVWGLLWIAIGFLVIKYTYPLVQTFGKIPWAERTMSGAIGGTYSLYKIVGVVIIFLGFLYMFGGFGLITDRLEPLFGG